MQVVQTMESAGGAEDVPRQREIEDSFQLVFESKTYGFVTWIFVGQGGWGRAEGVGRRPEIEDSFQ